VTNVKVLDSEDEPGYDRLVRSRPESLLYHSLHYRDLLCDYLGCRQEYLVALQDGEIRGVLPLMWTGTDGARIYNSLPFYGSIGSVLASTIEARDALLAAYNERATACSTRAATLVSNPFADEQPPPPAHTTTDRRLSQVTELPVDRADKEAVLELVDPSARRNVRKAEREGVEVARDASELGTLARIHEDNIRALDGLPKPPEFFAAVTRHFEPERDYDLYVARLAGEVVGCLLVFYFNRTVEYFTPAVEYDHRSRQPLAAILAHAMADAAARGFSRWNWGGTWETQEGVFRFKRKWGARARPYDYFIQLNDESLGRSTPAQLRECFGHFYVVPFDALEGARR
jgi:hypothetical protein